MNCTKCGKPVPVSPYTRLWLIAIDGKAFCSEECMKDARIIKCYPPGFCCEMELKGNTLIW